MTENSIVPTLADQTEVLKNKTDLLVNEIIEQDDVEKLQDLTHLFNLAQTKKAVLRTQTYNELLDHITAQMQERVIKRGDQFSNKDLLDYVNTITTAAEKAQKQIGSVDTVPMIQINTQNNIQVTDGKDLSKESRQRVMEAVGAALSTMGVILDTKTGLFISKSATETQDSIENFEESSVQIDDELNAEVVDDIEEPIDITFETEEDVY